jgi:4-amino-4-deoxy-L-arabinose transferase-like glycosyltransferase
MPVGFAPAALHVLWSSLPFCALLSVFIYPFYKRQPLGLVLAAFGVLVAVLPRFAPVLARGLMRLEESRKRVFVATVCGAGFLVRMPLILFPSVPLAGDNAIYLNTAKHIASGAGFGDYIVYPPGQSFWLAMWIRLFGPNFHILVAAQCALSLISIPLAYVAFEHHSKAAAVWSALVIALYPPIVIWSGSFGHETTVIFLCSLLFFILSSRIFEKRLVLWALCGVVAGIAALVRPTMLIFPALLAVGLTTTLRSWRRAVGQVLIATLAMAATIAPWTVRNYLRYHEFCLISSNLGGVLLSANHPDSDGNYMEIDDRAHEGSLVQQDHLYARRALQSILEDPARFAKRAVLRIVVEWGGETSIIDSVFGTSPPFGQTVRQLLRAVAQISWACFLSAWCIGASRTNRESYLRELPLVCAVSFAVFIFLLHTVAEPIARHHLPVLPVAAAISLPAFIAWLRATPKFDRIPG